MTLHPDIHVILPVRFESHTAVIPDLLRLDAVERVVVVDDGATEFARRALARWIGDRVVIAALPQARGWGAAVRRGLRAVDSGIAVALRPDDTARTVELLATVVRDGAGIAVGRRPTSPVRILGPGGGSFAVSAALVPELELTEDGPEVAYELVAQAAVRGWRVGEMAGSTAADRIRLRRAVGAKLRWSRPVVWRRDRLAGRRSPKEWDASDTELASTLDNLDAATNYARWIVSLMAPHLSGRILEVGAGHGTFTSLLAEHGPVTATELSDRAVAVLAERYADSDRVTVRHVDELEDSAFDTAVLVNVLEHIDDDVGALRSLRDDLRPGGQIVVYAPAFNALYSRFDAAVGHYRRYTRSSLVRAVTDADLEVVEARYVNALGALAWYVVATRFGQRPTEGWSTRMYDRLAVPVVRTMERRVRPPFGQSVLVVARRPAAASPD